MPSEGKGREFESRQARHKRPHIGLSPSGKATVFDTVIRWFESSQPSQNRQVAIFSDFFFILQVLILVRVQCFSKRLFFSPTRTQNPKKPYFTMLLSWEVKKSSQREADVFRLKFDVKRCSYNTLISTAISGALPAI